MDATEMEKDRLAIAPDKTRKTITLPKALVERVRRFRFRREFDQESDAYAWLLERGLEAAGREEQDAKERKR